MSMATLPLVWRSEDPAYEEARVGRVFNQRRPERYPLAVVNASEESHVVEAVKLAIEKGCRVSVRSGGHSWAVWSVRDNAILIDFGNYHEITLNDETGVVQVSPSTTSGGLNSYLSSKGRMFAGGHCPDVGLGGFLLQGGVGWNARGWGWACEQIVAIDVVTAEGRLVRADKTQNTELYWAARGCGPGFPGVITRFHLQTRLAPKVMRSSAYIYPVSGYKEAFDWILKITPSFDIDTEIVLVSAYPPGVDELCIIIALVAFKDSEDEAKVALSPAEESFPGKPVVQWFCQETSLEKEYSNQAHANPAGHRYQCENAYIDNDADVSKVLEKALTTSPSKETYAFWYPLNPWSRRGLEDMALSLRTDHYIALYTICKNEDQDTKCANWAAEIVSDLKKHSRGSYIGDIDLQIRTTKFWEDDQGKKLMDIRRKWDPHGVICGYLDAGDKSGVTGLANKLNVA